MTNFFKFLRVEILKLFLFKGNFYFIGVFFLFFLFIFLSFVGKDAAYLNTLIGGINGETNPWYFFYHRIFLLFPFLISIFLVLIIYSSIEVEHQRRMWKYLFVIPESEYYLILSKQIAFSFFLIFILFVCFVLNFCFGILLSNLNNQIPFKKNDWYLDILPFLYLKLYISLLPLIFIHIYLNIWYKRSLLLSLSLLLFSWLLWNKYLPHVLPVRIVANDFFFPTMKKTTFREVFGHNKNLAQISICIGYTLVLMIFGIFINKKLALRNL